ncbi:MAG: A/G-specific adenine glycosylase [Oscillospiraceae bacterium]
MKPLEQLPIPLLTWFAQNQRTMPWRSDPTPYHVWVSEIMLQQTRVAAVLDYYRRFMEAAPTVAELDALSEEALMKLWQGLGYYNRARNLQKAAHQIMTDFGGVFPQSYEEIRTLSGVGDYTAGAISSIAFGLPTPAVDGNVLRVVARITGDDGDVTLPPMKQKVTEQLRQIMPVHAAGDFTQAIMELGATVCLPNGPPLCDSCPARDFCVALHTDTIGKLPVKTPKKPRKIEERTVYLLFSENAVALRQRPQKGLLARLWEYPNTLSGENPPFEGIPFEFVGTGKHIFTHIEWRMTAVTATVPRFSLPEGYVWATAEELSLKYTLPNAFDSFSWKVAEGL